MSKREGDRSTPENVPEAKKPRLTPKEFKSPEKEKPIPEQRPNSPVPGPSNAPSDPDLQATFQTGLVPAYRYFDPRTLQESSSQGSDTTIEVAPTTSETTTSFSTNVEVGSSLTTLGTLEDMDIDSEVIPLVSSASTSTTTSASTTTTAKDGRNTDRRRRKHRSRRDQ